MGKKKEKEHEQHREIKAHESEQPEMDLLRW